MLHSLQSLVPRVYLLRIIIAISSMNTSVFSTLLKIEQDFESATTRDSHTSKVYNRIPCRLDPRHRKANLFGFELLHLHISKSKQV